MIEIFNAIIASIGALVAVFINLLPTSPFVAIQNIDNAWVKAINWIFPVPEIIAHLEAFALAVIVYYAIRVALKWIKLAGS